MHKIQQCKLYWITGCIYLFIVNGITPQQALAFQTAIWVSPSGSDTSDGSQATPYQTINFAASTISTNDTILLQPGVYQENVVFNDIGDFVIRSASTTDTAHIQATQAGPAISINAGEVTTSRAMVIENILISHADGIDGPGVSLNYATVTLRNNRIFNNKGTTGGGVYIFSDGADQPLLENNIIELNSADMGAGIYCAGTPLQMRFNSLRNNTASLRGGGVHFTSCYGLGISKNKFYSNVADSGGAVFIESSSAALTTINRFQNNILFNNTSTSAGAGLYYEGNAVVWSFSGNTFAENHTISGSGGAGYFNATSSVIVQKNNVVQNTADINGGAFIFENMLSANVYLWSNNITGNRAGNSGGGIYINNVNQLTVGGSNVESNNLFHNRANSILNNITSANAISTLNLSYNYWGAADSLTLLQQFSIPGLLNSTWANYTDAPIDVKIKLYEPRDIIWFADGKITFNNGSLQPVGDSTLVVRTHPDTSFTINDNAALLPKIYHFNWNNVNSSATDAQLTFFLDESELNDLGNPFYQNLRVLQNDNSSWAETSTDADVTGTTISTIINDLNISDYTIGLDLNASDTLLIVAPRPNRADVNRNEPISILFQKAMEPASLSKQNIQIHGSNSGNRDFDISFDTANNRLFLLLRDQLQAGETVSVVMSDALKTTSGELFNGYSWQYNTSAFRGSANFQALNAPQMIAGNNCYLFNDFNNDLKPELVELADNNLTVFTINDDGTYSGQSQALSGSFNLIKLADLNNDFLNEIIIFNDSDVLAYSYNPDDGFNEVFSTVIAGAGILNDVSIFDFNNDAIPDIAFLRDLSDFRQMDCYYGMPGDNYILGSSTSVILSGLADKMSLLDWNADGLFDLIISNGSSSANLALLTNQKNSFSSKINNLFEIFNQSGLTAANVWEDLQYQNQSEIIVTGTSEGGELLKLFNVRDDGSLVETHTQTFSVPIENITSGDLNSDGFKDLAVSYNKKIKLLLSNSKGMLEETLDIDTDLFATDLLITDFDADGDLDLFIYEEQDGSTLWQILENETRNPRSWWVRELSNGGDGSFSSPFGKINDALAKTFENDSVFVFPGNYSENLSIKHNLFMSSADSFPVVLSPNPDDFFQQANINVSGMEKFSLINFSIAQQNISENSIAFNAENVDNLMLQKISINQYDNALQINSSKGSIADLHVEQNTSGIQINNSEIDMMYVVAQENSSSGLVADNSVLDIAESSFRENGIENSTTNAGINISNGSFVSMFKSESSRNGNANIQLDNSTLNTQFVYIGQAESNGQSSEGNGIFARNNALLNLYNTVVDNNYKIGIALENSNAVILNSILVNNDSTMSQSGGGLFARAGSNVDLRNSIVLANNAAITSNSSTITANYNSFFANASEPSAALLGTGNVTENPLLVFMYNPLNLQMESDGFENAKLAPGSPLIDAGDPNLTNGAGLSRSDIGIFGNIGLPETFESIADPTAQKEDSSVVLTWSSVSPAETDLWEATAVFRGLSTTFQPDTSNLIAIVPAVMNSFEDNGISFGNEYYYRLAYVDTNGAANAYSNAIQARIDYSEITLQDNTLNVQLGQGDSLVSSVGVRNTGTVPVTVLASQNLPQWLNVLPTQQIIARNQNAFFQLRFSAEGLEKDSLYSTTVQFSLAEDSSVTRFLNVQMLVSYRDFKAPQVTFNMEYPDTIRQSGLSFIYSASDSINSTIGTPTNLLQYIYRFGRIVNNQPVLQNLDTTLNTRVDFYPLDNGRYFFEVAAIDTAGNGGLGLNSQSITIVVQIDDLSIYPKIWQMIAFPRHVLDSGVSINPKSIESLRHWNDEMYEHVSVDSILPGKGYWVISKDRKNIDLTRFPLVASNSDFSIDVTNGWNMIGNPWSWNTSLDSLKFINSSGNFYRLPDAISQGFINAGIYTWKSSKNEQGYELETSGRLRINVGYWINTNQAGTIEFSSKPFINTDILNTNRPVFPKINANSDGLVRLKIKRGVEQDNDNYFGVCQDKSIYPFYLRDAMEAPAIYDNIRLFTKKDAKNLTSNLVEFSEFDSVYVWDIQIAGNVEDEHVSLSWDLENQNSVSFFLYNLETGKWFNLEEQESLVISTDKSNIPLKLFATTNENFKPEVLPIKFSLSQNYPNPFNPSTSIKVSIPYYADGINARIDVFDVLGRKVKNILNSKVKSGEIEVLWKGINEWGNSVASGIYFYRLKAGDFVSSKKMILIR